MILPLVFAHFVRVLLGNGLIMVHIFLLIIILIVFLNLLIFVPLDIDGVNCGHLARQHAKVVKIFFLVFGGLGRRHMVHRGVFFDDHIV